MIYKIDCVELKTNEYNEEYGEFIIDPLDRGEGLTLANSIRRILLSDLEGLAITGIRIAGINSEFSILPGVREDVLEIILNIKEIVLKGDIEKINQPILGRLKIQGPAIITAGLIDFSEITVVNKSHYIATISDNSLIEMEFKVEKGKNYRIIDSLKPKDPIDFLQIDSIFMPVRKVSYSIKEKIDTNLFLQKEQIVLKLWTNGSISPPEALYSVGKIFQKLIQPLVDNNFQSVRFELSDKEKKLNQIPIEQLVLSARAYNGLKRAQIHCIGDLTKYSVEDLKEIKNFGQKSIEEVVSSLKKILNITLK
jgi:DNA-directed RNA polymerase subunit alpha